MIIKDLALEEIWSVLGSCYKSICIRCLALKERSTAFSVVITLSKDDVKEVEKAVKCDFESIKKDFTVIEPIKEVFNKLDLLYDVRKAKEIFNVYKELKEGEIKLMSKSVKIVKLDSNLYWEEENNKFVAIDEYPTIELQLFESEKSDWIKEKIQKINRVLEIYQHPVDEIAHQWLKIDKKWKITSSNPVIYVVFAFPIYFKVEDVELKGNTFNLNYKLHRNLKDKLVLLVRENGELREPVKLSEVECFDGEFLTCKFNRKLKENTELLEYSFICNNLGTFFKDKIKLKDPMLDAIEYLIWFKDINEIIKSNKKIKKKKNSGEMDESVSFERAVCWILSACGFQTLQLGDTEYDENEKSVDILAKDPKSDRMYVISCTTGVGSINRRGKSDKINNVAKELRKNMERDVEVIPIIFCSEKAEQAKRLYNEIKIIDKEDLKNIMEYLKKNNPQNAKKIIGYTTRNNNVIVV